MRVPIPRKKLREGSGLGTGDEHMDELLGSSELIIYITPNKRPKGYEALKQYLESEGCEVTFPANSPYRPGPKYQDVRITNKRKSIPPSNLRRAHSWAHQRNFLHSFFKPLSQPPKPTT